jgi:two-component system sensor histidine kinase/response regulator
MLLGRTSTGLLYVFETPTRLLVVDDDPIMLEFARGQLDHPGGEIVTASDGEEALAILERDCGFDLVLSDLEMPRMNGFALVDAIRRDPRLAHLPVVVITSRDDVFAIDRAYEVGATSFTTKPVNWRLLGYQLRYVLRAARMESQMRLAHARADQADRLKESLLALLQHETRTPLNAIIGYSELMQATLAPTGDPRAYVDNIVEAARGLNDTLRRVFTFAQLTAETIALDREIVRAADLVEEEAHRRRRAAAAAGIAVCVDADPDLFLNVDSRQIAAALGELTANALRFAPAGTTVTLSARLHAERDVRLEVSDSGPGLDDETAARCREPFMQAENALVRRTSGLGLGLPTARRIAEMHGGALTLSPRPGGGLSAALVLPVATTSCLGMPREAAE